MANECRERGGCRLGRRFGGDGKGLVLELVPGSYDRRRETNDWTGDGFFQNLDDGIDARYDISYKGLCYKLGGNRLWKRHIF